MDFSSYTAFTFERSGGVLYATINNPDKMNSLSGPAELEVSKLFYDVTTDEATRVLVITGAGERAFSAGGDINHIRTIIDNPDEFYVAVVNAKRIVNFILDCPKPIIAKVNGIAAGLGATIALMADVVFAADHAKFADPHVKVGLTAGDGGAVAWPTLIPGLAKHYLMTGDPITAQDAERLGMIYKCLPAAELDEVVETYAQRLATGPRRAIETSKMSVNVRLKQIAAISLDAGIAYEALSSHSSDHLEAVNSFLDKRKPSFTGK
ncbi:MAG: Enoyl-CoA hydratase/isomerase [Nocardioidaceae bacterium]|nr:Enoyl-CoA hydratase/isomerase [Nocardioidaceae bacterium]